MQDQFHAALRAFWDGRNAQAERQRQAGRIDAGLRGAVTGGGHLNPLREVLADLFIQAGIPAASIHRSGGVVLPGYFRPTKQWDLVVTDHGSLVAAIELKSQVGPSFGNNVNNRTEEALGSALDIWKAYESGALGTTRPWLGYVFVLEDVPASNRPVSSPAPGVYAVDAAFRHASYADRYRIFCDRLVKERLYDAAWFVLTSDDAATPPREPDDSLSFAQFSAAIAGRVAQIRAVQNAMQNIDDSSV